MLVLAAVLVLVALGVWLYCLFEVLSTTEGDARHLPKFAWFMIVLLGFDLGAIAWLVFGRRRGFVTADVTAWPPDFLLSGDGGRTEAGAPAPMGPDDDPEFLRQLDRRLRGDE
ncbi:PLD nuclease N-terminal domain-containing protein [Actinomadura sp. DC4]|uniref:PLD nuclease N-terminal domain-containing protein n=1 Tax=Actinomadura sp. DC4 TaxID=3055069 RepID=UPI0025B14B86|nr:PLD nuclease N-terminal domain-containing protein [Actinomadura sp. DC4]MDN3353989.1 PLD nuclease N-terminal domain-containing protein [Actinomadura sp. DC4]